MYQHKFGVPRDYKRTLAYYRSAANQGYALAQYNLGGMFSAALPDWRATHKTKTNLPTN
jgi:TPR repeat protein